MDLLRRRAAGELSALVGEAALEVDREVRVFRLRAVARRATEHARRRRARAAGGAYTGGRERGPAGPRRPALRVPAAARGAAGVATGRLAPVRPRDVPDAAEPAAGAGVDAGADARHPPSGARRVPGPDGAPSGTPRSKANPSSSQRSRGRRSSTCARGRRGPSPGASGTRPWPSIPCASPTSRRRRSSAATTGRWRARTPLTVGRSSPTTCTSATRCRTSGTAPPSCLPGADGEQSGQRGDAARRALRRGGQQRPRGLGLHQQPGRLGRPRGARARPAGPRGLPHARGAAEARARDRDDPR